MKQSKAAIVFTVMNILLIMVCGIFFLRMDRTKPEFKFQVDELVYSKETQNAKLLENITASDKQDGNVTERIVIEKIVENQAESSAIIFYAVSDKAGNVAKISRVFPADLAEEVKETAAEEETERMSVYFPDSDRNNGEVEIPVGMQEGKEQPEEEKEEEANAQQEEDLKEDADDKSEQESEDDTGEEAEKAREIGEKPVITLKSPEINTAKGVTPAWVEIIGSLTDDRDSYETLFYNLSVSKYDVNTPGTYKVALTTSDTDGNTSEPATLTIHVK